MIRFEIDYYPISNEAYRQVDNSTRAVRLSVDSDDRDISGFYQVEANGNETVASLFMMDFLAGCGLEMQIGKEADTPDDVYARLCMMKMDGKIDDFRIVEGAEIIEGFRTNNDEDLVGPEGGFDIGPIPDWITEAIALNQQQHPRTDHLNFAP